MKTVLLLLLALPAAAAAAPFKPSDRIVKQRVTSGEVTAEFSYRRDRGVVSEANLRISRAGRLRLDADLKRVVCRDCPPWRRVGTVTLRSLDGDTEPELLLDLHTGGAHCCLYSLVYGYRAATESYVRTLHRWGDAGYGYTLRDLGGDGRPELVAKDARFVSRFTSFAASLGPVRIWRYQRWQLRDVTRQFPGQVETDARELWRLYLKHRLGPRLDVRGILAAWMADQVLLGREAEGWRTLERAYLLGELGLGPAENGYPAGRRYLAALRSFLRRAGYLR